MILNDWKFYVVVVVVVQPSPQPESLVSSVNFDVGFAKFVYRCLTRGVRQ